MIVLRHVIESLYIYYACVHCTPFTMIRDQQHPYEQVLKVALRQHLYIYIYIYIHIHIFKSRYIKIIHKPICMTPYINGQPKVLYSLGRCVPGGRLRPCHTRLPQSSAPAPPSSGTRLLQVVSAGRSGGGGPSAGPPRRRHQGGIEASVWARRSQPPLMATIPDPHSGGGGPTCDPGATLTWLLRCRGR